MVSQVLYFKVLLSRALIVDVPGRQILPLDRLSNWQSDWPVEGHHLNSPTVTPPNSFPLPNRLIYKILPAAQWQSAVDAGVFTGSPVDHADGYIHFSSADQLDETMTKHFAGQSDLVILEVDPDQLGDKLKWEPSRGGDLFPHLYGDLPVDAVKDVRPAK